MKNVRLCSKVKLRWRYSKDTSHSGGLSLQEPFRICVALSKEASELDPHISSLEVSCPGVSSWTRCDAALLG